MSELVSAETVVDHQHIVALVGDQVCNLLLHRFYAQKGHSVNIIIRTSRPWFGHGTRFVRSRRS